MRSTVSNFLVLTSLATILRLAAVPALHAQTWHPLGPTGGSIHAMVVDPATPALRWVATSGGVYRSVDGGATWSAAGTSSARLTEPSTLALAIDPRNSSALYAGTRNGIFRSRDGGFTWTTFGLEDRIVQKIAISPTALYAGTDAGVYRNFDSDDPAAWTPANLGLDIDTGIRVLDVLPARPSFLLAGDADRLFRSRNDAEDWGLVAIGAFVDLAFDPLRPRRVWAALATPGAAGRVQLSEDDGAGWTPELLVEGDGMAAVAVDPGDRNGVYAAAARSGLYRSGDQGETWEHLSDGLPGILTSLHAHPLRPSTLHVTTRRRPVQIVANPTRLDDPTGIWESSDGGHTWRAAMDGLSATRVTTAALLPGPRPILLAVVSGIGLYRSRDGGATWRHFAMPELANINSLLPDGPDGALYAATQGAGVLRSTNGGITWEDASAGLPVDGDRKSSAGSLAASPGPSSILYATVLGQGLYQRTEDDATWRPVAGNAMLPPIGFGPIEVGPSGDLWLGTLTGLFQSADGGNTWTSRLPGEPVRAVAIGPSATLWVGRSDGLLRSRDGGATWEGPLPGVSGPVTSILPAFDAPSTLWVGTQRAGVLTSTDAGDTWTSLADGLPVLSTSDLFLSPDGETLYASTINGGLLARARFPQCEPSPTRLCLTGGRFAAEVEWTGFEGETGLGQVVAPRTDDSGMFFFFSAENWEMLVKVLNGCPANGHFWVFSAASTRVGFTLRVTDTRTGEVRLFTNPVGQEAAAIAEIRAFSSCP